MRIRFLDIEPELQPFVARTWICESEVGLPPTDVSVVAPNGCAKLIVPIENALISVTPERGVLVSRAGGFFFVGNRDSATHVYTTAQPTAFIGVEFVPHGVFPLFGVPMAETTNYLLECENVFDRWGKVVGESLGNIVGLEEKAAFLQRQLVERLSHGPRTSALVAHAVELLHASDGLLPIRHLERESGYSRRYLTMMFNRHVGLPPKALARIFRFQRIYRHWATGASFELLKSAAYDSYYDQPHFTREFKRMTSYSPRSYMREVPNEFGRTLAAAELLRAS